VPVIPVLVTRLFKTVFTARACTCKLSTSFLCPIRRNRHKSTAVLLSELKRAPFYTMPLPASRHWQTRISSRAKHIQLKTARRLSNASPTSKQRRNSHRPV